MRKPKGCKCKVRPKTAETHYRDKSEKDGWEGICRVCRSKHGKNYRKRHPKRVKAAIFEYNQKHPGRAARNSNKYRQAWLELLKARGLTSCGKCGYNKCFAAIDFHHVNPDTKETGIGRMLRLAITDERLAELDKTTPLCRNCHAELHWRTKEEENDIRSGS